MGTHSLAVLVVTCDNPRGGQLQGVGFWVWIEEMSQGDFDSLGIEYGGFEVHEEALIASRKIAEGEAMYGELALFGGGPEGKPWGRAHREGFVETGR